jgi:predicted secreted protein
MSSKIKLLFFGIFLLFASIVQAATPTTAISVPTKSIVVKKDSPQFSINLSSNPTTGYSWMVERYSARFIELIGHHYQASQTNLIGASGMDIWTFKVKPEAFIAPRVLKIHMLYAHPWNISDNSKKTVFSIVTQ